MTESSIGLVRVTVRWRQQVEQDTIKGNGEQSTDACVVVIIPITSPDVDPKMLDVIRFYTLLLVLEFA